MTAGVHDGQTLSWFPPETIDAGQVPAEKNWRTLEYPLKPYAGKTVNLVVKVALGGPLGVCNEEAFFDEISVVPQIEEDRHEPLGDVARSRVTADALATAIEHMSEDRCWGWDALMWRP